MESVAKRRALGRGLGALIPGAYTGREVAPGASEREETAVALASIHPNPQQPRQMFSEESIRELADSIRQKGILQPLLVRPAGSGRFELIAGERRFRAAHLLKLDTVPVVVREATDGEALEMALVENIQRENLNPLEEARAYRRLLDEFHLTQDEVAKRVGKDRSTVANTLRLLQLPDAVKADIESGNLSAGHARALVTAGSDAAKLELAREVLSRRLTVRQTEQLAKRHVRPLADADQRAAEQRLTEALGTRVRLAGRRNGSLEELNGLIERLCAH